MSRTWDICLRPSSHRVRGESSSAPVHRLKNMATKNNALFFLFIFVPSLYKRVNVVNLSSSSDSLFGRYQVDLSCSALKL